MKANLLSLDLKGSIPDEAVPLDRSWHTLTSKAPDLREGHVRKRWA